jgi:probable F420-dependent oxidoreductase
MVLIRMREERYPGDRPDVKPSYRPAVSVRVGIGLFTGQVPVGSERTFAREYREMIDLVKLAEDVGFSSAWVSEHHGASDGYLPSLLVMLGAFAAATSTIELGTGVVLTPLHDPIRLAEDAAVVDQLSEGRLVLGLGLGWRGEEFRMLRIPFEERLARHVETIQILRRAWSGDRFSFEGGVFRLDRIRVSPPPARLGGPPILLGGYVDAALRRAAELGDGHLTDGDDPPFLDHAMRLLDEAARSAGKDPAAQRWVLFKSAFVADRGEAWSRVRDGVVQAWGCYEAWGQGHDTPDHDGYEPRLPDEAAARGSLVGGTADEVAESLEPLAERFADRDTDIVLRLHYPGMALDDVAEAVRAVGRLVIPRLVR